MIFIARKKYGKPPTAQEHLQPSVARGSLTLLIYRIFRPGWIYTVPMPMPNSNANAEFQFQCQQDTASAYAEAQELI